MHNAKKPSGTANSKLPKPLPSVWPVDISCAGQPKFTLNEALEPVPIVNKGIIISLVKDEKSFVSFALPAGLPFT